MLVHITNILLSSWQVLCQMGPYLIFGFFVAGILSELLKEEWVEKHLGGNSFSSVIKASFLAVPMPLCSCGVIPVTVAMKKQGASRSAAMSFLLTTPQTGAELIFTAYSLLGPVFAIVMPIVAFISGMIGGILEFIFDKEESRGNGRKNGNHKEQGSCKEDTYCDNECRPSEKNGINIFRGIKYGFLELPREISLSLLFGILVAGGISVFVKEDILAPYLGHGIFAIFVMMFVGIPIYVCSIASIPLALAFMHLGASPGAALAFLISGPATNAATIAVTFKIFGRRGGFIYLFTVALAAMGAGILVDTIFKTLSISPHDIVHHAGHEKVSLLSMISAGLILLSMIYFIVLPFIQKIKNRKLLEAKADNMLKFKISGMSCGHCVKNVHGVISKIKGVEEVNVILEQGEALVKGQGIDTDEIVKKVNDAGYEAELLK